MSETETNQPITELCERLWKTLIRHGRKSKERGLGIEAGISYSDVMRHRIGDYFLYSENRHLSLYVRDKDSPPKRKKIFGVDEDGNLTAFELFEVARAVDFFRKEMLLDDLADV